ncbi:MAG: hypothetical protein RPR97_13900 [Colwellia sp.]|jgi:hypothetical protein
MNWKIINSLFEGVLGKSLLIIALATPVSFFVKANIDTGLFVVSLIGAITILIGYTWVSISTPALIKNYTNGHNYAQSLIKIETYIDNVSEFKILEDNSDKLPSGFDGYFYQQGEFKDTDSTTNEVGKKQSIRHLSILKFNLINEFNSIQRWSLTILFFVGSLLVYIPLIYRIFIVLGS